MFYVLLEVATQQVASQSKPPNMLSTLLPFALMFAILYFLIIRPQKKKQNALQSLIDGIKINDKVITNAGIIGKVVNIKKDKNSVILRVDDTTGTKIEFQKSAIVGVLDNEEKKEKS